MTLDSGPLPNTFPPSVKDPQAPGTYPIWYPACVDRLLLRSRDLCTAYLSNHLSDKSRVRLPSAPIVRQFRTPAHRRTQCCRQTPAELISTLQLRRVDSAYSRRRAEEADCIIVTNLEGDYMRPTQSASTTDLIQTLTKVNAHTVIPSVDDQ
jgi:hypothetical protein